MVGVSVKQKLVQNVPRCNQTARSLIQLHRRDPSNWLTYQHLNFLKRQVMFSGPNIWLLFFSFSAINYPINHLDHLSSLQYVTKNNSELHQRAIPKRAPVLTIVDERDDSVERQVQRIPTIEPVVTDSVSQPDDVTSKAQPEISNLKPITEDVAVQNDPVSSTVVSADEAPHVHVEPDEAREARLDKQWKQLKVDVADLPDIYGRLAKIKLTGRVHSTDTRL